MLVQRIQIWGIVQVLCSTLAAVMFFSMGWRMLLVESFIWRC